MLIDKGFSRVRPLQGGIEAWIESGHPVEDAIEPSPGP